MIQTELSQLQNNVEVIGILKSKELELKTSKANKNFISGKLVVQSSMGGKIHENIIEVFVMSSSKLFKGIETVRDEFKTIDQDGIENANRIRVTGSLKLNEFINSQGNLVQYNEIRGTMFNRLDANNDSPDKAVASIETVVDSFVEELDEDQLPTGDYCVNGFTIGWKGEVIELKNTFISAEIAQAFKNLYQHGSTGRLSFQIHRFAEEEVMDVNVQTTGFGTKVEVEGINESNKKYVRKIEIIGGDLPFFGTKELSPEQITLAKQSRALKIQELMKKDSVSTIPTVQAFSKRVQSQGESRCVMPTPATSSIDMPDF
ncbi:hypothetical protein [Metabacillus idriensis]|uniref:hypothetical protein n=1 Tax=Metabacillus idriensis TaxID=324768 RepID=UPI0017480EE7|nr:hypothetical protein [Metabacillus idriensis]